MIRRTGASLSALLLALVIGASPAIAAPDSIAAPGENPTLGRFLLGGADPAEGMGVEPWPLSSLSFDQALYKFTTTTGIDLGDDEAAALGEWILGIIGAEGVYSQLLEADPSDRAQILLACGLEMDGTRDEGDARAENPLPLCNLEPDGRLSALLFRSAVEPMVIGIDAAPEVEGRVGFRAAPNEYTVAADILVILMSAMLDIVAGSLIESCMVGGIPALMVPLLAAIYSSLGPLAAAIRQGDILAAGGEFLALGDSLWTMLVSGYIGTLISGCAADEVLAAASSDLAKRIAFGVKTALVAAEGAAVAVSLGARALSGQAPAEAEVAISRRDPNAGPISRELPLRTCGSVVFDYEVGMVSDTKSKEAGAVSLLLPPELAGIELLAHATIERDEQGKAQVGPGLLLSPPGYSCVGFSGMDAGGLMLTRGKEEQLESDGLSIIASSIYEISDLCANIPQIADRLRQEFGWEENPDGCKAGSTPAEELLPGLYSWSDGKILSAFSFGAPPKVVEWAPWGTWFSCGDDPAFSAALCRANRDAYYLPSAPVFELRPGILD